MAFAMDGATLSDECSLDPDEVGFAADGAALSGAEQHVAYVNKHEFEVGSAEFEQACREKDARTVGYRCVKRLVDVVVSLVVVAFLVLLWPLTLMVLAAAAVSAHANPLYVQKRVGQYGRVLNILKLRTMVGDSDDVEKYLDDHQLEQWRKERKVENDPRITKVGAFLRKTSLDEIPQFINVLLGHIPLRILKTRPEFSEKSMGAFALPAKSSTNKGKAFSQVVSCFANGLRMRRISKFNCNRIRGMEAQFLAKPVFGAVCA